MNRLRKLLAAACVASTLYAQQAAIAPERPTGSIFIRPYEAVYIPPTRMNNTLRFGDLIRGGKMYLTAQDAIALTLENNIDLELDRYNPLIGQWDVERAEAGGALPGVPSGSSAASSVATGQGVAGSQQAAGVSGGGNSSSSGNTVGGTVSQIGSVTPVLDPVLQSSNVFTHLTTPSSNTYQTGVVDWIQNKRNYSDSISQGLISGGTVSLSFNNSYLNENVPSDILNPTNGTALQLSLQHNLLSGFGVALNSRNITIQKRNLLIDDATFHTEVMGAVANTLNLYYGLAADYEDLRAKQQALDVAQQFFENNKKQVQVGTMAPIDVTTAEAQVASSQQDLVVSQTTLAEQEVSLKNVISRNGLADPVLAEVQIIPVDRIVVPDKDDLPAMKQLIKTALINRYDLQGEKLNLENSETSNLNTANAVLPLLVGLANASTQGLSGQAQTVEVAPCDVLICKNGKPTTASIGAIPPGFICPHAAGQIPAACFLRPDNYFVGGLSNALGQMIRRDFPSQSGGAYFSVNARNRQAQADYAIDQLSTRQTELQMHKDLNQVAVDVSNQMIGLEQARVRYQAAIHSRILEQQLLDAEQKKFSLGASTTFLVVQQQRDLATAQSSEVAALVAYSNARVALDQTLGTTLQVNHVSVDEAAAGRVARHSALPEKLPNTP